MTKSFPTRESAVAFVTQKHTETYSDANNFAVFEVVPLKIYEAGPAHWWIVADVMSTRKDITNPFLGSELRLWHIWEQGGEWHARSWPTEQLQRYDCPDAFLRHVPVCRHWKEARKRQLA